MTNYNRKLSKECHRQHRHRRRRPNYRFQSLPSNKKRKKVAMIHQRQPKPKRRHRRRRPKRNFRLVRAPANQRTTANKVTRKLTRTLTSTTRRRRPTKRTATLLRAAQPPARLLRSSLVQRKARQAVAMATTRPRALPIKTTPPTNRPRNRFNSACQRQKPMMRKRQRRLATRLLAPPSLCLNLVTRRAAARLRQRVPTKRTTRPQRNRRFRLARRPVTRSVRPTTVPPTTPTLRRKHLCLRLALKPAHPPLPTIAPKIRATLHNLPKNQCFHSVQRHVIILKG